MQLKYFNTSSLFEIMRKNMFDLKQPNKKDRDDGSTVYYGDSSYMYTEAKLFEQFHVMLQTKKFNEITMLSERGICDSCLGVMEQFKNCTQMSK